MGNHEEGGVKKNKLTKKQKDFIKIRAWKKCPKDKIYVVATKEEMRELGFNLKPSKSYGVIKGIVS